MSRSWASWARAASCLSFSLRSVLASWVLVAIWSPRAGSASEPFWVDCARRCRPPTRGHRHAELGTFDPSQRRRWGARSPPTEGGIQMLNTRQHAEVIGHAPIVMIPDDATLRDAAGLL